MKFLCVVLLFVASSSALSPEAEKIFQNFMTAYPNKFQTQEEIEMRRTLFSEAYDKIMEHNADSTSSFKLGFTPLTILTGEEKTSLINNRFSTSSFSPRNSAVSIESDVSEISEKRAAAAVSPTAYDSRNTTCGAQMKIKDQGSMCGSCWSFSALASIEYAQCNKTGNYTALSEQQLTSCVKPGKGCISGDLTGTFNWILGNNGNTKAAGAVATAASYPYVSGNNGIPGTCKTTGLTVGATLKTATMLPCAAVGTGTASVTTAIENAIMQYGVVSNCLYIPLTSSGYIDNTFNYYTSGVYSQKTLCSKFKGCNQKSTNINHCTAIVGWGYDSVSKKNYWIMRNQWGTGWGIKGYMWIEKGVNMCGVESEIYYVTVA